LIETASPATIPLALLIGFVCLASGIAAMLAPAEAPEAIGELERSPLLGAAAAFAAILFGAFVILFHRSWASPLAILVSLIGWVIFVEGLVLLGAPRLYARIARPLMRHARSWGLFALVLGAFLIAGGLAARAAPLD
jgi:uncharacterized protein YjeT (DUF2065 family)